MIRLLLAALTSTFAVTTFAVTTLACSLVFPLTGFSEPEVEAGDGGLAKVERTDDGAAAPNADAAPDRDADAAADFCPPGAFLCDDFERTSALSSPWTGKDVYEDGNLDTMLSNNERALRSFFTGSTKPGAASVWVTTSQPKRVSVAYAMQITRRPTKGGVHVSALFSEGNCSSFIYVAPGFEAFGEYCCPQGGSCVYDQVTFEGLSEGAWHDIKVVIDFQSSPPRRQVFLDGLGVVDSASKIGLKSGASVRISAGISFADDIHSASEIRVDRYVVQLE